MHILYLMASFASLAASVALINSFCRHPIGRTFTILIIFLPYVFLGMIRIRCRFGTGFNCGWMSFTPGVTWHIIPAAIVVGVVVWLIHYLRMMELVKPLSGAWVGLLWYSLPIAVIHPPSHGGPCPSIPIICHDVPLLGMGGLFYWLLPFVLWTMFRVGAKLMTGSGSASG